MTEPFIAYDQEIVTKLESIGAKCKKFTRREETFNSKMRSMTSHQPAPTYEDIDYWRCSILKNLF